MDFVADDLTGGCKLRTLTLLDLFTRQCLDIAVGRGLTGQDVVTTLERLRFDRGLPQRIYCDNVLPARVKGIRKTQPLYSDRRGHSGQRAHRDRQGSAMHWM